MDQQKKLSTASISAGRYSPATAHKKHSANNLGVGFDRRHKDRRASSMQLERAGDGKMLLRGEDGKLKEVEVISTRTKESFFERACPVLPMCPAVFCAFLNFVPGLGTFVAAFLNLCFDKDRKGRAERRKKGGKSKSTFPDTWYGRFLVQLLTAILQVVTAFVIAGIVWSIMYGVTMIQKSKDHGKASQQRDQG